MQKRDPFEAHVQQKLEQAADEIERLTAEVSVLRKNLVQAYVDNGCYLDEALEIAGLDVCPDGVDAPVSDRHATDHSSGPNPEKSHETDHFND